MSEEDWQLLIMSDTLDYDIKHHLPLLQKSYNKPLNFKMEIPDTIFCLKIKFWIRCCFKTPKVI